jgi:DHA2 family multidrug resistance protein-like MFS transporter
MASFTVGMAIGPVAGGLLLETFWWGSVFLMGVPVMAVLLATAPFLLPEYRDPRAGRIDLISVALSLAAILPIVYGVKNLAKSGLEAIPIIAMATGAAFGLAFVRRQRGMTSPLLDLELLRRGAFRTALGVMLLCTMIVGATLLFATQYLQMVEGLSPLRSGLWLVPFAVATTVSSMLTPVIARWLRPGPFLGVCYLIAAAGFLLLTQVDSSGGLPFLVAGLVIVAIGMAPVGVLVTDLVVGSVPPERAGSASSLSETSAEFGNALGVAVLGSIGTAIYRTRIADSIPDGVPAAIASPTRDTLAGATTAVSELPGPLGAALLDASRQAFTAGMSTVAGISAVAAIAIAVLAFARLHDAPPDGTDRDTDQLPSRSRVNPGVSVPASD